MNAPKQILVATDFSEPASVALTYGRCFARSYGGTLHVLHVVEDGEGRAAAPTCRMAPFDREQQLLEVAARRRLAAIVGDNHWPAFHVEQVVLTAVAPARAILDYAERHKIDLIVLGRHRHTGMGGLFMGSVAQEVFRLAACPVLTVRHPAPEFLRSETPQRSARWAVGL